MALAGFLLFAFLMAPAQAMPKKRPILRGLEQQLTLIGNAGTVNLSYDVLGRLSSKAAPHWNEMIPENGYNAVGSLVEATITDPYGSTNSHYCYDDLYQLIDENGILPPLQ